MKVAFFHEYYRFGGAEKVTSILLSYLIDRGCEVYIFVRELNMSTLNEVELNNVTFIELADKKKIYAQKNMQMMVKELNRLAIDIFVIPVMMLPSVDYIRSNVASKLIFAHHGTPMWESTLALFRYQTKIAAKRSILYPFEKSGVMTWIKRIRYHRRFLKLYHKVYDNVDAFTVLCTGYKEELCRLMKLDANDNRFEVMYNPLEDHAPYSMNKQKEVVFIGRLTRADKRVDRLLDIWGEVAPCFPDWRLKIVGDGEDAQALKEIADRDALPRVEFCGFHKDLDGYYNDAAILCLTSYFEGWALVITEAQQAGVVPIAYNCSDGVAENIGDAGVLVSNGDKAEYVRRLKELMADQSLRQRCQSRGIDKVAQYRASEVGRRWELMFERLLK